MGIDEQLSKHIKKAKQLQKGKSNQTNNVCTSKNTNQQIVDGKGKLSIGPN